MATRKPEFDTSNIPEWTQAQIVSIGNETWVNTVLYDSLDPEVAQTHESYSKKLTGILGQKQHPTTGVISGGTPYELHISWPDTKIASENIRIH